MNYTYNVLLIDKLYDHPESNSTGIHLRKNILQCSQPAGIQRFKNQRVLNWILLLTDGGFFTLSKKAKNQVSSPSPRKNFRSKYYWVVILSCLVITFTYPGDVFFQMTFYSLRLEFSINSPSLRMIYYFLDCKTYTVFTQI